MRDVKLTDLDGNEYKVTVSAFKPLLDTTPATIRVEYGRFVEFRFTAQSVLDALAVIKDEIDAAARKYGQPQL